MSAWPVTHLQNCDSTLCTHSLAHLRLSSRVQGGVTSSTAGSNQNTHAADRVLQGIAHKSLPHYGVQFHPESIGTAFGRQLLQNFRDITVEWHRYEMPHHAVLNRTGAAVFCVLVLGHLANSLPQESIHSRA